jgi:hypothetical protein
MVRKAEALVNPRHGQVEPHALAAESGGNTHDLYARSARLATWLAYQLYWLGFVVFLSLSMYMTADYDHFLLDHFQFTVH